MICDECGAPLDDSSYCVVCDTFTEEDDDCLQEPGTDLQRREVRSDEQGANVVSPLRRASNARGEDVRKGAGRVKDRRGPSVPDSLEATAEGKDAIQALRAARMAHPSNTSGEVEFSTSRERARTAAVTPRIIIRTDDDGNGGTRLSAFTHVEARAIHPVTLRDLAHTVKEYVRINQHTLAADALVRVSIEVNIDQ